MHSRDAKSLDNPDEPWRPLTALTTVTNPETLTTLTTSHSPLPIRPYRALLVRDFNSEGELLIRLTFLSAAGPFSVMESAYSRAYEAQLR